jgi:RimJ/RimL family protein N-acetyltransferase
MIVDSTDRAVGLVSAYGFNGMNRTVYLSVIVAPSAARSGMAFEALSLFVEHLFQTWDLRKIYAEAIYENYLQFASGAGRIFVEEGRLSEHEYFNGRYHDFLILALSRDRWISLPQRLRGGFANSESGEQASTSNERELE